jgi:hypothetical protein
LEGHEHTDQTDSDLFTPFSAPPDRNLRPPFLVSAKHLGRLARRQVYAHAEELSRAVARCLKTRAHLTMMDDRPPSQRWSTPAPTAWEEEEAEAEAEEEAEQHDTRELDVLRACTQGAAMLTRNAAREPAAQQASDGEQSAPASSYVQTRGVVAAAAADHLVMRASVARVRP